MHARSARLLRAISRLAASALALLAAAVTAPAASSANPTAPAARPISIDTFESSSDWIATPASGVEMKLSLEPGVHGNALRVDFTFTKGGGYAVLHRKLSLDLPDNYRFEYALRGETAPQNLEFKLIDDSGDNVWWSNRINFDYPRDWATDHIRKRQISYAWGPKGGGELRHAAALEFAITAGSGGSGTVWFDDLTLIPLPVAELPPPPIASATSQKPDHAAAFAVDATSASTWESTVRDSFPALTLELGTLREFGGLVLDWGAGLQARDYAIDVDEGTGAWRTVREVRGSDGGRDWLELPESEATRLRLRTLARTARTVALANLDVKPLDWGATAERFLTAVAQDAPRGHYPRGFRGEQSYWTVVGVDGDVDEGLFDEDLRLETGRAQFSLEPFLFTENGLRTWADGRTLQSLASGSLPLPTAVRIVDSLALSVTVFARPSGTGSELVARYRVKNLEPRPRSVTMLIALRPFQVNPPSQFLNVPGGPARITSFHRAGARVQVNGDRWLAASIAPDAFEALAFDEGDLVERLRVGRVPRRDALEDSVGRASGVLRWTFDVPASGEHEIDMRVPFHGEGETSVPFDSMTVARWQAQEERGWSGRLGTLRFSAGGTGSDVAHTLTAQLAYVLVNRDRAGIQPGSRSYERSWIRDGSLSSSALLRSGMMQPVQDYLKWFATFQYADGKVPCCVDRRGSDPVPENDSHGEFVFLAAEYLRLTHDAATVEGIWPNVRAAVAYMDTLRAQRRTAEWRTMENAPYFGLLPPSISHEGYSAKPMHSYWDNLFALRGYRDGAWLAQQLGHVDDARWMKASGEEFAHDFGSAAKAAMRAHDIRYVPGCSDLGDFDATSTTIALTPVQAAGVLPVDALKLTFERYWTFFQDRRSGEVPYDAYTPYELRNVGAFVRLGWRERAHELLDWFMADRRPQGWRQWAEVVDRLPRRPRFLGDMPHTWVGTDFVRSVQEMLAYENEDDSTLVIAAGIPEGWLDGDGVEVRGLQTRWGVLGYKLTRRDGRTRLELDSSQLRVPPGGLVFAPPLPAAPTSAKGRSPVALVDGKRVLLGDPDRSLWWAHRRWGRNAPTVIEWGHEGKGGVKDWPTYKSAYR